MVWMNSCFIKQMVNAEYSFLISKNDCSWIIRVLILEHLLCVALKHAAESQKGTAVKLEEDKIGRVNLLLYNNICFVSPV